MMQPQIPENEDNRLAALHEFNILDTLPEKDFDDITLIASQICNTPISLITLVDMNRQWFKASHGLEVTETAREHSFCAHAINTPGEIFIVPDSSKDIRFCDNPYAIGEPHVTFYAGIPLVTDEGYALGTLCVIDSKPGNLTETQVLTLKALANQIVVHMELRKKVMQLNQKQKELERSYEDLDKFAHIASHDLKSPLNSMLGIAGLMRDELAGNEAQLMYVDHLHDAARELSRMVDGILEYSKATHIFTFRKEKIVMCEMLKNILNLLQPPPNITVTYPQTKDVVFAPSVALKQILMNLIGNAIKFNDKEKGRITIGFSEDNDHYNFTISDNGPGIPKEKQSKIFDIFEMIRAQDDTHKIPGTGIGLSTVKRLTEKLNGEIMVSSTPGEGTTFNIMIGK